MTLRARYAVVGAVLAVGFFGFRAAAQMGCMAPSGWPMQLTYFCSDEPARADHMNANFKQLVTWIEGKVGTVGQPYVIAPNSVSTVNIVDGGVTTTDLAPGAVDTTALANDSVTAAKVAGRVAVYTRATACSNSGDLTLTATCGYSTSTCGTCLVSGLRIFASIRAQARAPRAQAAFRRRRRTASQTTRCAGTSLGRSGAA